MNSVSEEVRVTIEVVFEKCTSESVSLNSVDLTFRNSPVLVCVLIYT